MAYVIAVRTSLAFDLVSTIETTLLSQSAPKLLKVFIDTRSQMSSIMSKISLVILKLFALELLKIAVLNLVSTIETTFLNQYDQSCTKYL